MVTAEQTIKTIGIEITKHRVKIEELENDMQHLFDRMVHGKKIGKKDMPNPFLKENAEAVKKKYKHLTNDAVQKGDGQ